MGAEAWIYFCHQWLLVSVGQLITSSRILSKPVKPRKPVKYRKPVDARKPDLPNNRYYQLLFKPVSPMVQYVVLPPCFICTSCFMNLAPPKIMAQNGVKYSEFHCRGEHANWRLLGQGRGLTNRGNQFLDLVGQMNIREITWGNH